MPLHKAFERVDDNNRGADENGTFDISWRIIIRHRHLSLPGARAFVFCPHSHSITRSSGPIPLPARSCAFNGHVCADWRAVLCCAHSHTGHEAAHKSKQSQIDRVCTAGARACGEHYWGMPFCVVQARRVALRIRHRRARSRTEHLVTNGCFKKSPVTLVGWSAPVLRWRALTARMRHARFMSVGSKQTEVVSGSKDESPRTHFLPSRLSPSLPLPPSLFNSIHCIIEPN